MRASPTLVDLSMPISASMPVFPGDPKVCLERVAQVERDGYNAFALSMGMHAGTHVDAPNHFFDAGEKIDACPLYTFMGEAVCLDARGFAVIPLLETYVQAVNEGDIVLFHACDSLSYSAYPVLSGELCAFLLQRKVRLIGMDTPSPDNAPYDVHKALLRGGVPIVENLCNLGALQGHVRFFFMALPLRICAEASPVRACAFLY